MKYYFQLTAIVALIIIFSACRKLVTDEFPELEQKPVVNALFTAKKPLQVQVSLTQQIGAKDIVFVDDASIILFENDSLVDTLHSTVEGIYVSNYLPKAEHEYACQLRIDDEDIRVSSFLPASKQILEVKHIDVAGKDEEGIPHPAIQLTFENNPTEVLYFEVVISLLQGERKHHYNEITSKWELTLSETIKKSPELINITDPLILNEGLPLAVFSNELIHGNRYTMTLNYKTGFYGSSDGEVSVSYYPLIVELRTISYDYYRYLKQLYLYEQGRYPMVFGDVARSYPLYTNVENGQGIFAAYSSVMTDTIIPDSYNR